MTDTREQIEAIVRKASIGHRQAVVAIDAIMALMTSGTRFTGADGREMVVVPVEPTQDMLDRVAGRPEHWPDAGIDRQADAAVAIDQMVVANYYRAMIAAASDPDAPSGTPL